MKKLWPLVFLTSLACSSLGNIKNNNSMNYKDFFPNEKYLRFQSYTEEVPSSVSVISKDDFYENQMAIIDVEKLMFIYLVDYKDETSIYKKGTSIDRTDKNPTYVEDIKDNSLELTVFYLIVTDETFFFNKSDNGKDTKNSEFFKEWDTIYNKARKMLPVKEQLDEQKFYKTNFKR